MDMVVELGKLTCHLGTKYLHLCRDWMLSINFDQTRKISFSNKHVFLSFDTFGKKSERICLFSGSIATQSQMYSDPTFNIVSSTTYSRILLLVAFNFWGRYF